MLSIIPQGAIRTRVGHASVTWATRNKLTHLITLTLTSSVLDVKGGSLREGTGPGPGTSPEPLMSLGLFVAATVHPGTLLPFWSAHSPFAYLTMVSCCESLPSFIHSGRWCKICPEGMDLLQTSLSSQWTTMESWSNSRLGWLQTVTSTFLTLYQLYILYIIKQITYVKYKKNIYKNIYLDLPANGPN